MSVSRAFTSSLVWVTASFTWTLTIALGNSFSWIYRLPSSLVPVALWMGMVSGVKVTLLPWVVLVVSDVPLSAFFIVAARSSTSLLV